MSKYKRCIPCYGSGKVMGGGCILVDCDHCDGAGKVQLPEDEIDYLEMKTTESYKKAIKEIKSVDGKITDQQAEEMFDKEFKKIDKEEKKVDKKDDKK